MSATLRDRIAPEDTLTIGKSVSRSNTLRVAVKEAGRENVAYIARDEMLTALSEQLDSIVIPREVLPTVDDSGEHLVVHDVPTPGGGPLSPIGARRSANTESIRLHAHALLALAEHLEKHPPVDEAQVDALESILGDFAVADEHSGARDDRQLARLLVARGVRVEGGGAR